MSVTVYSNLVWTALHSLPMACLIILPRPTPTDWIEALNSLPLTTACSHHLVLWKDETATLVSSIKKLLFSNDHLTTWTI